MPMKMNCDKNIMPTECIRTECMSSLLTILKDFKTKVFYQLSFALKSQRRKDFSTRNAYFSKNHQLMLERFKFLH